MSLFEKALLRFLKEKKVYFATSKYCVEDQKHLSEGHDLYLEQNIGGTGGREARQRVGRRERELFYPRARACHVLLSMASSVPLVGEQQVM